MISPELRAHVVRLHVVEKWNIYSIAKQLGIHHATVRRTLFTEGVPDAVRLRPSKTDPFVPFVTQTLTRYPDITAARVLRMIQERGYCGGPSHIRQLVGRLRPRQPAEAFLRRATLPGEEAQVDWASFGKLACGRATRNLSAFVMVLSYSRMLYVHFFIGQTQSLFLQGHQRAFEFFGGVPKVLLYDNLKSAVLERIGDGIRFHPTLWSFAQHYNFQPMPVGVRRGNEKGRVERTIRYLRTAFFPARKFTDLADLNAQAQIFCEKEASQRRNPEDQTMSVRIAWELERPRLSVIPASPFASEERVEARARKTPYVRFDKNDYSIPHTAVRRMLTIFATHQQVRVMQDSTELVVHERSYDQGITIENPAHIEALRTEKRLAREPVRLRHLTTAAPAAEAFLKRIGAKGGAMGASLLRMERMLDLFGPAALQVALVDAEKIPVATIHDVHMLLDQRDRQLSTPPPTGIHLPHDSPLRALSVTPHSLASYDTLNLKSED